jgi:UDPglucose 6-dehydrogenase
MRVGFIGQGWIGKNYADHYEDRGFDIVRYSQEPEYAGNREAIADCEIVFIAVPTPTTPAGFSAAIVEEVLGLIGAGKTAVIKSTVLPGTTRALQEKYPKITVLFSPEFLREATVRADVDNPDRNIIGITREEHRAAAEEVVKILPKAPYEKICTAEEAELVKYGGNIFLFWKVIYMNMLHDLASCHGADWQTIAEALAADPRIGTSHMQPVHASGHTKKAGRGAGGHCFIKDFAAFHDHYVKTVGNEFGIRVLEAMRDKNIHLLTASDKDLDMLEQVYGKV